MEKSKTLLKLENVFTSYGKVKVLNDINMEVNSGEIVCLLGSNGSGKSTTIKTIIGVVKPTSGSVVFLDSDITQLSTHEIVQRGISIVPEGRRLFPRLTVKQNLDIPAYSQKKDLDIEKNKNVVFQLFPVLKERLNQVAGTLSGGEQAMVAIARGLITEPDLLILDEPSFGLAPVLVEEFYETIREIKQRGVTILLSEQNAGKALEVADRGYVLQKGVVVTEGPKKELEKSEEVRKAYLGG